MEIFFFLKFKLEIWGNGIFSAKLYQLDSLLESLTTYSTVSSVVNSLTFIQFFKATHYRMGKKLIVGLHQIIMMLLN